MKNQSKLCYENAQNRKHNENIDLTIKEFDEFLDEHPQFEDARRILVHDYELLATLLDKNGQTRFAEVAREKAQKLRDEFGTDADNDRFDKLQRN